MLSKIKAEKSIAMLAPTFILDFSYPNIIGMLRDLGFDKVTELTFGARMVNWWYEDYIKEHPDQKYFIASPCPTVVSFIKNKYPDLVQYLMPFASPMLAMARVLKKHYQEYGVYFISPCYAKQSMEAPLYPQDIDGVITLKELQKIFAEQGINADDYNRDYQFDSLVQEYTRVYPISGGLAHTSHIAKYFQPGEVFVDDGIMNIEPVLQGLIRGDSQYRFLDILNCNGGCIGGPAINSQQLPIEERRKIVRGYVDANSQPKLGDHRGHLGYAESVDLGVKL